MQDEDHLQERMDEDEDHKNFHQFLHHLSFTFPSFISLSFFQIHVLYRLILARASSGSIQTIFA